MFPYTTLFRSSVRTAAAISQALRGKGAGVAAARRDRSEEHTSELQSQSNLVCRLLLEKKKARRVSRLLPDSAENAVLDVRAPQRTWRTKSFQRAHVLGSCVRRNAIF